VKEKRALSQLVWTEHTACRGGRVNGAGSLWMVLGV